MGDKVWVRVGSNHNRHNYPHSPLLIVVEDVETEEHFRGIAVNTSLPKYHYLFCNDEVFEGPKTRKGNFIGGVQVQQ